MVFPLDPEEIRLKLMRLLRPPTPPWVWMKARDVESVEEPRVRKGPALVGSRMIWPYRITWRESLSGKGVVKVLKEEHVIGTVSYTERGERVNLVRLLGSIIGGEK